MQNLLSSLLSLAKSQRVQSFVAAVITILTTSESTQDAGNKIAVLLGGLMLSQIVRPLDSTKAPQAPAKV